MKTSWRSLGALGRCAAAMLLFGQTGCLVDQLNWGGSESSFPRAAQNPAAMSDLTKPVVSGDKQPATKPETHKPTAYISFSTAELSLNDLMQLAMQNHPALVAAQARVQMARGQAIQAGLYPNPTVSLDWDTLNTKDFPLGEPGALIAQEFVTAHKLKIARAAAEAGVQAADWDAMTRWFEVVTRVRYAYIDLLAAQREEKAAQGILNVAQDNLDAANKLFKAGVGVKLDVLRAETELELAGVQKSKALLRAAGARKLLAVAVGVTELPHPDVAGDLELPVPVFGWKGLVDMVLAQSSEVQAAQARLLQMQTRLRREEVEKIPNILTEFRPFYSFAEKNTQIEVIIGAKLPLFNRNQGNILAAQGQLVEAEAAVRESELKIVERLADAFRRYQIAQERTDAYRNRILPKARESLELVMKGYKSGDKDYNFTILLQTQQIVFQAELSYVAALDDLWRAIADIEGLLQREETK